MRRCRSYCWAQAPGGVAPYLTEVVWSQLFDIYRLHFATELPFLHLVTLKEKLGSRFRAKPSDESPDINFVLLGILTLTARFHKTLVLYITARKNRPTSDASSTSEYYADVLTKALGSLRTSMTVASVERVQAFLMLGLYEYSFLLNRDLAGLQVASLYDMPDEAAALVPSLDAEDTAHSADRGNVDTLGPDKYRIENKLGEGSFGVVFKGVKLLKENPLKPLEENPLHVAIKFEARKCSVPQLRDEYRTYKILTDGGKTQVDGIPRIHYFGPLHFHNVLVVDLLGLSLESIFAEHKRRFTLKTVAMLAKHMLGVVERVHTKGIVHRDLKPDNFLLGRPGTPAANKVHLIDFGMAKRYKDPKTQEHIPYHKDNSLVGTARYMSINTHLGRVQSRRDDLEALCYVWLYFLRGSLPWQGIKAPTNNIHEQLGKKKQETAIEDLCAGFPVEFAQCLQYGGEASTGDPTPVQV
ncbi:hypothetical protein VTK56DRAFT_3660 [Thermocarpiscus australiensis]